MRSMAKPRGDHGDPIEPLAFLFVRQLKAREALVVEAPDGVHPPHAAGLARNLVGLILYEPRNGS